MTDFGAVVREAAPEATDFIRSLTLGSAERFYCTRYLAHRFTDTERPAASGYAIGVEHAAELRRMIEERLPAEMRDLQRP